MVNLTLTNKNPLAKEQTVTININTGLCYFADQGERSLKQLINEADFIHPLITEPYTPVKDGVFHYEYDNLDELFYAGIYVYSRLIHSEKPLDCIFKINPSPRFQRFRFDPSIYFSINKDQVARESIQIKQLEAFVTHIMGFKFEFSEDIIIDAQLSINDLPMTVDGDLLYESNNTLLALLKQPQDFSRYELRYISPEIGFGVFSKENIKEGEIISFYTGIKTTHTSQSNYTFISQKDCLQLRLDARKQGNITRFINHAPKELDPPQKAFITANIESLTYEINGIEVIVYSTTKDIMEGEQLLVDYGVGFFKKKDMLHVKANGQFINSKKKFTWSNSGRKIHDLRIMAVHGVKKAQFYLIARLFIIMLIIIGAWQVLLAIFNHKF